MKPAHVLWVAAAVVLLCGYGAVVAPRQHDIDVSRDRAAAMYEASTQNEREIAAAAGLRAVESRIGDDVRSLAAQRSAGTSMAADLRVLSLEADRHHVRLTRVAPQTQAPPQSPAPSSAPVPISAGAIAPPDVLAGVPVDIGVAGRFRDIVRFIADVPKRKLLFDVAAVDFDAASEPSAEGQQLNATIHATLYRFRRAALPEVDRAAPN